MFRRIREALNNRKYKKILKQVNIDDTVYVDLGSTSIKMAYNGELITFKSSIREVRDIHEITPAMKNYIEVNNKYYIIGEAEKSNEVCDYKVDRKYIDIIILYGLKVFKYKGIKVSNNLKINILLPFDEIQFKSRLEKRINSLYKVESGQVTLTVNKIFLEGESSSVFYREHYKAKGNIIVANVGGKTTDIHLINSDGYSEKTISIDLGTQYLLSQLVRYTKAPTSNILSQWLADGYKFTKEEKEHVREVGKDFISNIWNDVYSGVIKIANPQNTTILIVGGGANILKDSIKESLPNSYKVKTLSNYENIYADLLGAVILDGDNINIPIEIDKKVDEVESIKKVSSKKGTVKKKGKYEDFVLLKKKGMEQQDILDKLGIALQTYRNMQCKYNKENRVEG